MKKKLTVLMVFVLSLLLLTGCNGGGSSTEDEVSYDGDANVQVVVDWDEFNTIEAASLSNNITAQNNESKITHTGARIVYVGDDAAFTQSVEKETAAEEGVITFKVPASDNVNLFTVAVSHNPEVRDGNRVYWLGYIKGLRIQGNSIKKVGMEDINWVKAEWRADETENEFQSGYITRSNEDDYYRFPIYVKDPFQIGEEVKTDGALISINGHSSIRSNPDGWRKFVIYNENTDSQPEEETYDFQPFVHAKEFNLSTDGSRYFIPPMVEDYTINWE